MKSSQSLTLLALIGCALLFLVGGVAYLLFDSAEGTPVRALEIVPAQTEEQAPAPLRPVGEDDAALEGERAAVDTESLSETLPGAEPEAPARNTVVLTGSVVLKRLTLGERFDCNGEIDLLLWAGNTARLVTVPIVDGRFRLELYQEEDLWIRRDDPTFSFPASVRGARITPQVPELEETQTAIQLVDEKNFAFGDEVVLVCSEIPALTLVVEDADTGTPLDDVTVLKSRGWFESGGDHPGANPSRKEALVRAGRSPILLAAPVDGFGMNLMCFVHSPGYAWAAVQLNFSAGGERRVRLERGGDLEVQFTRRPERAALRLWRTDDESRPFLDSAIGNVDSLTFAGITPGEYRLSIEIGPWYDDPLVLAREDVRIHAGEWTVVQPALAAPPEVQLAELAGTLILPEAWDHGVPSLQFELLDTSLDDSQGDHHVDLPTESSPGVFPWRLGKVQTGRYAATYSTIEYSIVFELGPEGRNDVVFEIPAPVEIAVLFRDVTSGETADVNVLHWNCAQPKGMSGWGLNNESREPGDDWFRFRVPDASDVTVGLAGFDYTGLSRTFRSEAGLELVLEVRPTASGLVQLLDGDVIVPWPRDDYGEGTQVDGSGKLGSRGHRPKGLWFTVTGAGRYRITIPSIVGYEPHEPVEADLAEGETTDILVRLVRKP